ncbi:macrophage mannose receptor 1-like [Elysia marginata]|uniref:Macrophage mannose receptor 1-like n=1 Tax=Elysia marginata TaxID=1093978 RepID=A0AAV4HNT9_9GAST|nr:macrophage mannose receptor 1-like [Elysia marginata]
MGTKEKKTVIRKIELFYSASVKAACPSGWRLSPEGAECVKVVAPPTHQLNEGGPTVVCGNSGLRPYEYIYKNTSRFIHDMLPLDTAKFFWVKLSSKSKEVMSWFTKYEPYSRKWKDFYKDNSSDICAQVNILLPETLKNEKCSSRAGAICSKPSIQCSSDVQRSDKPGLSVHVERASCQPGWMLLQGQRCFKVHHKEIGWHGARQHCRQSGGDLLNLRSSENYMLEFLGEHLKTRYQYWVKKYEHDMTVKELSIFIVDGTVYWASNSKQVNKARLGFICEKEASTSASDKCPPGMYSYLGVCLEVPEQGAKNTSWSEARAYCQLNGGDLVRIANRDLRKKFFIYGKAARNGAVTQLKLLCNTSTRSEICLAVRVNELELQFSPLKALIFQQDIFINFLMS